MNFLLAICISNSGTSVSFHQEFSCSVAILKGVQFSFTHKRDNTEASGDHTHTQETLKRHRKDRFSQTQTCRTYGNIPFSMFNQMSCSVHVYR